MMKRKYRQAKQLIESGFVSYHKAVEAYANFKGTTVKNKNRTRTLFPFTRNEWAKAVEMFG